MGQCHCNKGKCRKEWLQIRVTKESRSKMEKWWQLLRVGVRTQIAYICAQAHVRTAERCEIRSLQWRESEFRNWLCAFCEEVNGLPHIFLAVVDVCHNIISDV